MGELFDTRQAPRKDRMAFWLDTVCQQILPVKIDPRHDAQPEAAMGCRRLGDLAIREVVGGDHVYVRDDSDVRRGDPGTVQIGIPTGGASILVQDGREAVLNAGDMVLYDSSRPFTLVMQNRFHWHVFLLPKHKLRRSDQELRTLTATAMRGDGGVSAIVSQFLLNLAASGREFERQPTAAALGENAADLIGTLVQTEFGRPWTVGDPEQVLRQQVLHHLEANHHDAMLDPAAVAAAVGISVRSLHALFGTTGATVMERLRSTRLTAIRRDLSDPRLAHRSIGRIAAAHGLPNATVFTRMFKTEFGVTPREFRSSELSL
ncbi:AraC-like ligand-binding domain-containing protein [Kribbella sp. NPDC055071]